MNPKLMSVGYKTVYFKQDFYVRQFSLWFGSSISS